MLGVILTGVVEVSSQGLEGRVPVLLDGDALAAAAQTAALRQHINWATTDPALTMLTFQIVEDGVRYLRHAAEKHKHKLCKMQ